MAVEGLEGGAKEERGEVRAQVEGAAVDVDKTDNDDTGADAYDKEMASQEEQHDEGVVRERILETSTPVAPLQLRHLNALPEPTR